MNNNLETSSCCFSKSSDFMYKEGQEDEKYKKSLDGNHGGKKEFSVINEFKFLIVIPRHWLLARGPRPMEFE